MNQSKRRKGLSSIVAAVLLLSVSVTLAGIYANWAPDFSEDVAQKALNKTNKDITCQNAAFSIKEPVYDRSADKVLFELQNTGTIRFSKKITVAALNSSSILNRTDINGLDVEESVSKDIPASKAPDSLIASSPECPSLDVKADSVRQRD